MGKTTVFGHVMEGVEARVDVLHEQRCREGRKEAERRRSEIGRDLCGFSESDLYAGKKDAPN